MEDKSAQRYCKQCKLSELELIDKLIDLLQDVKKYNTNQNQFICQECLSKKALDKNNNDLKKKNFKHPSIIKFQKDKQQRTSFSKMTHIPQLVAEILIHFKSTNQKLFAEKKTQVEHYSQKKSRQQNVRKVQKQRKLDYGSLTVENNGDGKIASGHRQNWQKGITQIINAFKKDFSIY